MYMKVCFVNRFIFMRVKQISIWKVLHENSFWNRGTRKLGNGLFKVDLKRFAWYFILETLTLFVAVKTVKKLNLKHSDKFETLRHVVLYRTCTLFSFVWHCSRCRCRSVLNHHDNEMRTSQTKGLISKAIAVHVHYNSLYISLPSVCKTTACKMTN